MATLLENDIMNPVVQFVSANIVVADWKNKYASLMALGSITEGPDRQIFATLIVQSMVNLLNMFNDPNGKVREAISWVMSRICEHHAEVLTNEQIISQFLRCVLQGL
mmetsp:Transcript_8492/g.14282  ORF Transcript_8492/g.14282 Transcript_8492/m.14282 type:complete len:107 (+) Transcript_8492:1058-1378(+)